MFFKCKNLKLRHKNKQPLNADFCNRVFNNELKDFFEKHPEEIEFTFVSILEDKKEYYKKELGYLLEEE